MNVTTVLTGMLPFILLVAATLTAVASAFLLKLYRRATIRAMNRVSATSQTAQPPTKTDKQHDSPPRLVIEFINEDSFSEKGKSWFEPLARPMRSMRTAAAGYFAGGVLYALILTTPWMINSGGGFLPVRVLWLFSCYLWPAVLAVIFVTTVSRKEIILAVSLYISLVLSTGLTALYFSAELSPWEIAYFWLFANAPATILLLSFLHRRVRSVGPLVLTFMIAGVTGAVVVVELFGMSDSALRTLVAIGDSMGLNAVSLLVLMHTSGFLLFGTMGWLLLFWIGRGYNSKNFSDQSITIDTLFLLFGIIQSVTLTFEGWYWIFTGLLAFVGYKLVTKTCFYFLFHRGSKQEKGPILLLLRVFALGSRSESLFAPFTKLWRRHGSISLISGPDLVTATVEPHEFLGFLSGTHSRRFVQDEAGLEERIKTLDRTRDPDGMYRVNEFFCHANTWQMTMKKLARASQAVLMDLRSFSPTNQGCLYELEQLLSLIPLEQIVFLVDQTTDQNFLEQSLQNLWLNIDHDSPNIVLENPTAHFFQSSGQPARSTRILMRLLLAPPTSR